MTVVVALDVATGPPPTSTLDGGFGVLKGVLLAYDRSEAGEGNLLESAVLKLKAVGETYEEVKYSTFMTDLVGHAATLIFCDFGCLISLVAMAARPPPLCWNELQVGWLVD